MGRIQILGDVRQPTDGHLRLFRSRLNVRMDLHHPLAVLATRRIDLLPAISTLTM